MNTEKKTTLNETQIEILNNTSARSLVQVVYYDTLNKKGGTADTALIKEECYRRIEPLNDYLKSPLRTNNQVKAGYVDLGWCYNFIESKCYGSIGFVDFERDNGRMIDYIVTRRGFGGSSIRDLQAILDATTQPLDFELTLSSAKVIAAGHIAAVRAKINKPKVEAACNKVLDHMNRFMNKLSEVVSGI